MAEEAKLQNKILNWLHSKKIYSFKVTSANTNGVPDIVACLHGNFIGIEVKTNDGTVSAIQDYNHKRIRNSGGVIFIVRTNQLEQFIKQIEKISATIIAAGDKRKVQVF